jgi:hypothetical protein
MSDYYDDSFESESGSENGEQREEGEQAEAVGSSGVSSQQSAATTTTTRELHVAPNLLASPRLSLALRGHGSGSDRDEQETSRWRESKSERSPRPRRKFRVKKPNIGSFTQKIKNKLKKDSAVFGVTVEVAIQRSTLGTDQLELPTVFRQCIDFLEEHGVNHQGVYRLPGVKSKVEELKSHFDKGEVVDLSEQDPNTVASLLKLYLRELPEPLIPHSSLSGRIDNIFDLSEEEQSEILREVVDTLQTPNRLLLSWLLEHMTHIVGKSGVNKMTLPNMVIVFSPTLQLPAHFFHTLYNHKHNIFGDVPLTRFEKPAVVRKSNSKQIEIVNIDLLETEQDVNTELDRLTSLLMKRHSKVAGKFNSVSYVLHLHSRTQTHTHTQSSVLNYCILYPMYPTLLPCFTCLYTRQLIIVHLTCAY